MTNNIKPLITNQWSQLKSELMKPNIIINNYYIPIPISLLMCVTPINVYD